MYYVLPGLEPVSSTPPSSRPWNWATFSCTCSHKLADCTDLTCGIMPYRQDNVFSSPIRLIPGCISRRPLQTLQTPLCWKWGSCRLMHAIRTVWFRVVKIVCIAYICCLLRHGMIIMLVLYHFNHYPSASKQLPISLWSGLCLLPG